MPMIDPQTGRPYEEPPIYKAAPEEKEQTALENLQAAIKNLQAALKLVNEFLCTEIVVINMMMSEILQDQFLPAWRAYLESTHPGTASEIVKEIPAEWLQKTETEDGQN